MLLPTRIRSRAYKLYRILDPRAVSTIGRLMKENGTNLLKRFYSLLIEHFNKSLIHQKDCMDYNLQFLKEKRATIFRINF